MVVEQGKKPDLLGPHQEKVAIKANSLIPVESVLRSLRGNNDRCPSSSLTLRQLTDFASHWPELKLVATSSSQRQRQRRLQMHDDSTIATRTAAWTSKGTHKCRTKS